MTCLCTPDRQCQFHARQPRPCACGGTLQYYRGADGGQVVTFALTREDGFARRSGGTIERAGGAARMCNKCDHCEAA